MLVIQRSAVANRVIDPEQVDVVVLVVRSYFRSIVVVLGRSNVGLAGRSNILFRTQLSQTARGSCSTSESKSDGTPVIDADNGIAAAYAEFVGF